MLPSMGGWAGAWAAASPIPPVSVTARPRKNTRKITFTSGRRGATLLQTPSGVNGAWCHIVPWTHERPAATLPPRPPRATVQGGVEMSAPKQLFSANLAKDAVYKTGLRSFMEYRDLGIDKATHGQFRAHIVRIKKDGPGAHDLHTTGLHKHECDFQMFYVLKGWMKFVYENEGERTFQAGDCVLQPAGIVHNELDCSDDVEILEIYSPAVHATRKVEQMPEAAAATH